MDKIALYLFNGQREAAIPPTKQKHRTVKLRKSRLNHLIIAQTKLKPQPKNKHRKKTKTKKITKKIFAGGHNALYAPL